MNVPIVVSGIALATLGRLVFGKLRAQYLNRASKNVSVDASSKIVLRYAVWYYLYPALAFGAAGLMAWAAAHSMILRISLIYKIMTAICLFGGIWLFYRQLVARLTISANMLTYTEGNRIEVDAFDVDSFSLNGFEFIIKKRSQKVVRVPATFIHSELILAFLIHATINKR